MPRVVIDPAFTVGDVDGRPFGSFGERMGRAVSDITPGDRRGEPLRLIRGPVGATLRLV